jgi:hypothetical protein
LAFLTVPLTSTWPPAGPNALGVARADRTVGDGVAADATGAPNTSDPKTRGPTKTSDPSKASDPSTRRRRRAAIAAMGKGFPDLGMHDFTVKWVRISVAGGTVLVRIAEGRR